MQAQRILKDSLYEQVARMARAMASPKRLELMELLCQAPKSVDLLAREAGISIKLASAHLKALREARLVDTERQGKSIIYRIASPDIPRFWVLLRALAQDRLLELQEALRALVESGGEWHCEDRAELLRKARDGEVVVIDVRPPNEYAQAHFPYARSMPLAELRARLGELARDKPIVAYCRGPYCLMSADAVQLLREQGFAAQPWREGVADWGLVGGGEAVRGANAL